MARIFHINKYYKCLSFSARRESRVRAAELLRQGRIDEARSHFRRCVDITHKMALQLIKECRRQNVDCIVAPYEADGQLAYLNRIGIADYVITEDSDLILFGCKRILFKLDLHGNCLLVDAAKIHLAMGCREEKFRFEKFRFMCIMSGCDYLDSLPGIGLAKSCKFVLKTEEDNVPKALAKIPAYLNMRHLDVSDDYKEQFQWAMATFMHMVVYDPLHRKLVRLTDPESSGTDPKFLCNAGTYFDDSTAFQLALGNLDPFSLRKLDDWHPDDNVRKTFVFIYLIFLNYGFLFIIIICTSILFEEYYLAEHYLFAKTNLAECSIGLYVYRTIKKRKTGGF